MYCYKKRFENRVNINRYVKLIFLVHTFIFTYEISQVYNFIRVLYTTKLFFKNQLKTRVVMRKQFIRDENLFKRRLGALRYIHWKMNARPGILRNYELLSPIKIF